MECQIKIHMAEIILCRSMCRTRVSLLLQLMDWDRVNAKRCWQKHGLILLDTERLVEKMAGPLAVALVAVEVIMSR